MLEMIALKHINKAANGDPRSTAIVLSFLKPDENDRGNHLPELLQQFRAINARSESLIDVGETEKE